MSLVRRLFDEAVNQGHVDLIVELYAPSFVDHSPGPGQAPGPAGIIEGVKRYRTAIPDLEVTVEDVIVSGDRVVTRETWSGTHRYELAGLAATNRSFVTTRMHIFRVDSGRVVEEWSAGNVLDLLRTIEAEDDSA